MAKPIVQYVSPGKMVAYSGSSNGQVLTWDSSLSEWKAATPPGLGLTPYAVLVGGGAGAGPSALSSLGTAKSVLVSAGAGAPPAFGSIDLASSVAVGSSILGKANGGTGVDNTSIAQNAVFAGPGSGGTGAASFRALVAADIPTGIPAASITGIPYDIAGSVAGTPLTSIDCFFFVAVRACTIAASGHYIRAQTAPSGGSATFTVNKVSTDGATVTAIATATLTTGSKSATFSLSPASPVSLAANESITITAGSNMYNASNVYFTLSAVVA